MYTYEVAESHDYSDRKVVEVLVTVPGAEGPETTSRCYTWWEPQRYKVGTEGKRHPKTGADYKSEIEKLVYEEFYPKEEAPLA